MLIVIYNWINVPNSLQTYLQIFEVNSHLIGLYPIHVQVHKFLSFEQKIPCDFVVPKHVGQLCHMCEQTSFNISSLSKLMPEVSFLISISIVVWESSLSFFVRNDFVSNSGCKKSERNCTLC